MVPSMSKRNQHGPKHRLLAVTLAIAVAALSIGPVNADTRTRAQHGGTRKGPAHAQPSGGAAIYPQFKFKDGRVVRWIREQMPLKVYVSRGLSLDNFVEPTMGAPRTNVDNSDDWPNIVVDLLQNPDQINQLPIAPGYSEDMYQAALQGINSWKVLEPEGLYSFALTDNPEDADIFVFWTKHFVNKMGLALFANVIRG
jgi:hypothetical protein